MAGTEIQVRTQWAGVAIRLLCPEEEGNWPAEKEEKRGQRRGQGGGQVAERGGERERERAGNFLGSNQPFPESQLPSCPWVLKEILSSL